jgi:hypothetical protein
MKNTELRMELKRLAEAYAREENLPINASYKSATIFTEIGDNFFPASFEVVHSRADWSRRLEKQHQQVPGVKEMQSSNSSDAILMSIFCHPKIGSWKGVRELLGVTSVQPVFGEKPRVNKTGTAGDETEIDLALDGVFVEAKLTESGFTQKEVAVVEAYTDLGRHFETDLLRRSGDCFENYQVIRNLLAAIQRENRHLLVCDERRPDLVRAYFETVLCLRDAKQRSRCGVVFWQEIARVCGRDLAEYLSRRYGIS